MKKFLTVLLVIAVMFTFSFGSAFAAQELNYEGQTASKVLLHEDAFTYGQDKGEYGFTEAAKDAIVGGLQKVLDGEATAADKTIDTTSGDEGYNISSSKYYAPEKATAKAAIEKAIADVKAATKAKTAYDTVDALKAKLDKLVKVNSTVAGYEAKLKISTEAIDFSRLIARYGAAEGDDTKSAYDYYLPGYGLIGADDITTTATDIKTLKDRYSFIIDWFMDNEYRIDFASGVKAMLSALVPVTQTYKEAFNKELVALEDEAYDYADKYDPISYKNRLTIADLEGINTLLGKIEDFNAKYKGYKGASVDALAINSINDFVTGINSIAGLYFNQYYAEIEALPALNKLDDAKKPEVIALYKKLVALDDAYTTIWGTTGITPNTVESIENMAKILGAYNQYKTADADDLLKAYNDFTAYKQNGNGYYFDASEKNVTALAEARKAYDEFVKNYGYDENGLEAKEAKILAGENNKGAAADYDVKDNTKVQAYLNNATVKVTTKALGNTKIRVQATIDAVSFEKILDAMDEGCTVSYQFYHKTAKATAYKASTVKDRNYITYTKKSLKKGTKYKFQCSVIIKDANGNVVATKDYKASTIGSRVCR